MERSLNGLVIVITGGARGIGLATAQTLNRHGAKVAIGDIDDVQLKKAAADLGTQVYPTLDVTSRDSFGEFLDAVERDLGPIDVLINNAGIMPAGLLVEEDDMVTQRIIDINVLGVINGTKLAVRRMQARRRGHVINIASLAGEAAYPGLATYCASKFAVIGFSDAVRLECRGTGVDVSTVMPTFTNTELVAGTPGIKGIPNAQPEDIAAAVVGLIEKPRPHVRVTKLAGAASQLAKFMPRRAGEALSGALGAYSSFTTGVDQEKRRAYDERARGN